VVIAQCPIQFREPSIRLSKHLESTQLRAGIEEAKVQSAKQDAASLSSRKEVTPKLTPAIESIAELISAHQKSWPELNHRSQNLQPFSSDLLFFLFLIPHPS
jgi:hypothetical protein